MTVGRFVSVITCATIGSNWQSPCMGASDQQPMVLSYNRPATDWEKLPLADFVKLTTWVDANAQYFGTYYGRKNLRFKDHPNFRPVPTFAEAISTVCPTPKEKR